MRLPFKLLFGEKDLDSIRAKSRTDWGEPLIESVRAGAAKLLDQKVEAPGGDTRGLAEAAAVLAFAGLADGRKRKDCLAAAKARLLKLAELPCWFGRDVLHFGGSASSSALALDWGFEAYSGEEAARVLDALVASAIESGDPSAPVNTDRSLPGEYRLRSLVDFLDYRSESPFHAWAHSTNNWDVVIGAGLMLGSAVVERAATRLRLKLGLTRDFGFKLNRARFDRWYDVAKQRFMNFSARCFSHAGQYCEGPDGYYGYGVENCLLGLEVARRVRGDDLYSTGLKLSPRWQRELYPWDVASGAMNLSDADFPGHPPAHIIARLAAESRSAWMQGYFRELVRLGEVPPRQAMLSLVWAAPRPRTADYAATEGKGKRFFDFGDAGDVVIRTGRDAARDVHVVFRCGRWNAAHTHMDRNGLVLSAFGERLLVDAGRMHDYGHEAHVNYHTRTRGHNCALIAGEGQQGYNDHATWGRILRSRSNDFGRATVVGDARQCYARAATALRAVHFEPGTAGARERGGFLVVWDLLESPGAPDYSLLWHLDNRDGKARIEDDPRTGALRLIRPGAELVILPVLPPDSVERSVGWVGTQEAASLGLEMKRRDGRFLTLLLPLRAGEKAELSRSGDGAVEFALRGAKHALSFSESPPGFILHGKPFDFSREARGLPGE